MSDDDRPSGASDGEEAAESAAPARRRKPRQPEPDRAAVTPTPKPSRRHRRAERKRADALAAAALEGGASAAAAGAERGRGRAFRVPAVLVVVAAVVAAFVIQQRVSGPVSIDASTADPGRLMPTATPASTASSTWFCAGGTATGDPTAVPGPPALAPPVTGTPSGTTPGPTTSTTATATTATSAATTAGTTAATVPGTSAVIGPSGTITPSSGPDGSALDVKGGPIVTAEHRLQIANPSDTPQRARVTAYASGGGAPVLRTFDVPPRSRIDVALADLVKAPFASALVQSDAGLLSVTHSVAGPTGQAVAACASSPSSSWYFAAGSTALGTRQVLVAFNPYPERAVLDLSFVVEEEGGRTKVRDSDKLRGLVVPANGVSAIDITDIISVRAQISTVVQTRGGNGRVVVDRILASDGTGVGRSLNVNLGAPAPVNGWLFADGPPFDDGVETQYVLFNPSAATVEADVTIEPDARADISEAASFPATVRAGQYEIVKLGPGDRVPRNTGYWVAVQARNGATLVVERVVRSGPPNTRVGVSYTLGSPLVARTWIVPAARLVNQRFGTLSIANPATDASVTLTVRSVGGGESAPLTAFDRVELAAGRRTVVDLDAIVASGADTSTPRSLVVEATGPVVVEQVLGFSEPSSLPDLMAIPVRDTVSFPPADLAAYSDEPASISTGTAPPGSALGPGGTAPGGTAPGTLPLTPPGSGAVDPNGTVPEPEPVPGEPAPPATNPDGSPVVITTVAPPP